VFLDGAEFGLPVSPDLIFKKLPCQPLPLHRLLLLLLLSLLRRYVNFLFSSASRRSSDSRGTYYFQEKPKEKTIFNVKLESFDAGSKPKVIKEVKAMVPNLTLIEVRSTVSTLALAGNSHKSFLLRRRSLLSRYQRFLRRICPRRMPRSSRRSSRVSEPSSPWSKLCSMICLTYLRPHTPPTQPPLPFKTYLPSTQFNARAMGLGLLEVTQNVTRPRSTFSPP